MLVDPVEEKIDVKAILPGALTWDFQTVRNQKSVIFKLKNVPRPSLARYVAASLVWNPVLRRIDQTAAVQARSAKDDALLAAGASIDARDNLGRTALIHAARIPSMELFNALLSADPDPRIRDFEDLGAWDYVNYPPRLQVEDRSESVNMVGKLAALYAKWERK